MSTDLHLRVVRTAPSAWVWFGAWSACVALWLVMCFTLPNGDGWTVLAVSPTLVSVIFSARWMPKFYNWVADLGARR